ncbi:DEKNAAC103900, partial [Brettanomyces naardenensis]
MKLGEAGLPFLSIGFGTNLGCLSCIWCEKLHQPGEVLPENRLPPMICAVVCFPIGILRLCWTGNYPENFHWIVPTISGLSKGFGTLTIFNASVNYIGDSYLALAASASAANTFLSSTFEVAF